MRVAAVDCGTNSTRLLIAERDHGGPFETIERRTVITRLGQGVAATGRLDPAAIQRGLTVLRDYAAAIGAAGCDRVRITTTSAARDAANVDDFRHPAADIIGVAPEVLTGEEEAALTFVGATTGLDPDRGPYLVVDIGGGSTEFSLGDAGARPRASVSMDMGCVRLTETYLEHDPPRADELAEALAFVEDRLVEVEAVVPVEEARRLVGVAGTVTTLAAVALELDAANAGRAHHHVLTRANAEALFRRLASETVDERGEDPALEPGRAEVIVGGTLVLVGILRRWRADAVVVSEADILDGIALDLLER